MRKVSIFSIVLSLFLLVPASITWAQTVTQLCGLNITEFTLPQGTLKVYLPNDIRQGDVVSGSIMVKPNGANARQQQKAFEELLKSRISIGGAQEIPLPLSDYYQENKSSLIPIENISISTICTITLSDANNIQQVPVQVGQTGKSEYFTKCIWPTHALTGSPVQVQGNFDGQLTNTKCTIGGQPADILAESPRASFIVFPAHANGNQVTTLNEAGRENCISEVVGVEMLVTAGNLNLRKGESTYIDVKINGIQSLPDKAILTINNITSEVVAMTGGNLQIIHVWPPTDSTKQSFSVHVPAVALTEGNFSVTVTLELPQRGEPVTSQEDCPPQKQSKSCSCEASVSVVKEENILKANHKEACKGQYGVGYNTFPACFVKSVSYEWSIKSGQANISLSGKKDGPELSFRRKNNKGFSICVTMTVTCIDGTVCTSSDCYTEEPAEEIITPPPPTTTSSRCQCSANCVILFAKQDGQEAAYTVKVNASCKGTYGSGLTRSVCLVGPVVYNWSIGGNEGEAAEISGPANKEGVKIKLKKKGSFTLQVNGTVTCTDGTRCDFSCNLEIPYSPLPDINSCAPMIIENADPVMDGGLKAKKIGHGNSNMMYRDEFIALQAEGADFDLIKVLCNPRTPCRDTKNEKTTAVAGRVKFEWLIEEEGKGYFVQLGCLTEERNAEGEHVIFKPPVIPLPAKGETIVITTIQLSIIDDGSPSEDATRERIITIKTKRKSGTPDKYEIEIISEKYTLPVSPKIKDLPGTCQVTGLNWSQLNDLSTPIIERPEVPDNDKMVLGQWIILKTDDQLDMDLLKFGCSSKNDCITGPAQRAYIDPVFWDWKVVSGGGQVLFDKKGRVIVYEAPMEMPPGSEVIEVEIIVTANNLNSSRADALKPPGRIKLYVYQPGITLTHPPLTWLPEENNSIELKSELKYRQKGEWKPALAHMARIHFFELLDVSEEKGVCMNGPTGKLADQCRDLFFKNEKELEAFDDAKGKGSCSKKMIYRQARMVVPAREGHITVHCSDFGAYGFLRSFANVMSNSKMESKPVYIPIPVKESDVSHPLGRRKKQVYKDNRVTIPHDIDENHIADGGWFTLGNTHIPDPATGIQDIDDQPAGDGFKGDGLSAYEEYRGFFIDDGFIRHQRTNDGVKDIFIHNKSSLNLNLFASITGLDVHEIREDQYVNDKTRVINANFNQLTHVVDQKGLLLLNKGNHAALLGRAESTTGNPSIPNNITEVKIYSTKIATVCETKGFEDKLGEKMKAVIAHELLHATNVCHHGEGNDEQENSFNKINGLRSGNMACVMRYDNAGTQPEDIGSQLCDSPSGTGSNKDGGFKDAATNKGNCKGQFRVSGKILTVKSCGGRD